MSHIIDISLPLGNSTSVWPGDPPVQVLPHLTMARDGVRVSSLSLGSHTGTHIDAPSHLLPEGKDVMAIPLETLFGPAQVIDLPEVAVITAEVLQAAAPNLACPRVLLRTTNSSRHILHASSFVSDYVALEASGAAWIVDHGATLVGIDAMSVDPFDSETLPAHHRLLENGIIIAEGLDLWQALPGRYELVCAPLPIVGADGAPARAWLVR